MFDYMVLLPLIIIGVGAIVLMLLASMKKMPVSIAAQISMFVFALAFVAQLFVSFQGTVSPFGALFKEMLIANSFTKATGLIILGSGFFCSLMSQTYFRDNRFGTVEFFSLTLFAATGMLLLTMSNELITLFISLEIMSLAIYSMVGCNRRDVKGSEAVLKYLLLGAFAGAFYTMGTALVYGSGAGSTKFHLVAKFIHQVGFLNSPMLVGGIFFVLMAFLFKIAAFPFHTWSVDVYDGAPMPVTAFMATGVKTAVFAVLANFIFMENELNKNLTQYLYYIAILTMFGGNLVAIGQNSVKRMLAASGIVHSGYLLVALVAIGTSGISKNLIVYYLAAYALSTLGIFAALSYTCGNGEKRASFDDFKGLGKSKPYTAAAIAIFLLSMAGIPPTAGFMGKLYIIVNTVKSGYTMLALLAIASSILSMWYYLRLILSMFFKESDEKYEDTELTLAPFGAIVLAVCVFVFSFYPISL